MLQMIIPLDIDKTLFNTDAILSLINNTLFLQSLVKINLVSGALYKKIK
ncbi:hypothetical protein Psal006b_01781 [Piscirickettsia salmonis]|uniref:Uncharacterized protein n=1 Tax=Piscirickettsia salmonis TaxID=1238 RepID=A0AAC9EUX1_PISSA|nr:hypothetical protein KU39_1424 [Piscirickettsia salmonis]QGN98785.1 hypothetical protein Psal006b_01781 [Piscirickettsia salmonis]QGO02411.1 hypothetical protein Psal008_01798 [Piscirickettsia salmonis]QGO13086.1 hypothetical protein Psal010b_01778 [Piscirickettsia salmonis]QGO20139.1 hypothetical protein Psal013_01795 [Piscirickettsia salmonis]